MANLENRYFIDRTTEVVVAVVGSDQVDQINLPELIKSVYDTFVNLGNTEVEAQQVELKPAVSVKKSVTDDYIVCLEDGKKLKMLKRHLQSTFNMTPDEYRARWGLPADYPMVAPSYSKKRSEMSKEFGFGQKIAA